MFQSPSFEEQYDESRIFWRIRRGVPVEGAQDECVPPDNREVSLGRGNTPRISHLMVPRIFHVLEKNGEEDVQRRLPLEAVSLARTEKRHAL